MAGIPSGANDSVTPEAETPKVTEHGFEQSGHWAGQQDTRDRFFECGFERRRGGWDRERIEPWRRRDADLPGRGRCNGESRDAEAQVEGRNERGNGDAGIERQ